ncbi:hypothetical protein RRG08_033693 [Elysia crispata]|uniref:Uncharacterized protein n=1 Tax=Elysia crispata TaxID=231223 RepID=A0AAE1DVU6_9GAST|nr:hypothetical protein RRG08_033693 [Elysia crispata]
MNKNISMRPLSTFPSWIECRKLPEDAEGSANLDEGYCSGRVGHVAVSIMDELLVWGGYFLFPHLTESTETSAIPGF